MASGEITRCPVDFLAVQPYNKGGRLWVKGKKREGAALVTCRLESRHGLLTSSSQWRRRTVVAADLLLLLHLLQYSPSLRESIFFPSTEIKKIIRRRK